MVYSCPPTDVRRDHVESTVPQFIADLLAGLLIKTLI